MRAAAVFLGMMGLAGLGCRAGAPSARATAPAGWTRVYAMDFNNVQKVPAEWVAISGEIRVAGGALELRAEAGSEAEMVLKTVKCPGSVRVEMTASVVGDEVCDLSPWLNGDESGYASGYLLQFGGGGNQENRLRRAGEVVDETVNTKTLLKAGKKYAVVAENDGGRVRLVVDGQELLALQDKEPLKGPDHALIGFYTWGDTLRIERIAVFSK